jgi:hypothetical protein
MNRPNLVRDRFIADLYDWLTPDLLYTASPEKAIPTDSPT